MSASSGDRQSQAILFEIKGSSINLPALKLLVTDIDAVVHSLREKIDQAPEFFRDAPIVLDLHGLHESIDLGELCALLRANGLVPVGVRGGDAEMQQIAKQAHLAVFADIRHEVATTSLASQKTEREAKLPVRAAEPIPTKLVQHPVRSGQRIYAVGCDLVVLAPVSAGAEIMADGNIHVYGALRGRALAGVQGNTGSRIFCSDLQAELISIAGHYKVSEHLDESVRDRPVQIYLNNNALIIQDL